MTYRLTENFMLSLLNRQSYTRFYIMLLFKVKPAIVQLNSAEYFIKGQVKRM